MRRAVFIFLLALGVAGRAAAIDPGNPHDMRRADGSVDTDKCAFCHEPDMSLSRPKAETCTLCHAVAAHSGAAEHLRAGAANVARRLRAPAAGAPRLPLTEDGRLYCGTCHLFHDPAAGGEELLSSAWVPAATGLAGKVRESVAALWGELARRHGAPEAGARFATSGTRALRLAVEDGSLCRHCHGYGR